VLTFAAPYGNNGNGKKPRKPKGERKKRSLKEIERKRNLKHQVNE
jgi:hypothetical protein